MQLYRSLCSICLCLYCLSIQAQTPEPITSLEGAPCSRIVFNGTVYLTSISGHGVYYSSDGGKSWISTPVVSGAAIIMIDGSRILAYTGQEIFVSLDNCQSWITHYMSQVSSLFFKDGIIYRDDSYGGYWKSADYGATWAALNFAFKHLQFKDSIYFRSAWGSNTYQVYKSLDSGNTWTLIPNIFSFGGIILKDQEVWVLGNGVLYHSNDLGVTWTNKLSGANMSHLYLSGDTLYAFHSPYVSRTWDGGQNWQTLGPFSPLNVRGVTDICFENNYYLVSTVTGIYRTTDFQNWQSSSKGLNFTRIWSINTFDNTVFAVTSRGAGYVPANSSNWVHCTSIDSSGYGWKAVAFDKNKLIGVDNVEGVFQSLDTGKTWSYLGLHNGTFFSNSITYENKTIMVFEPGGQSHRYNESSSLWQNMSVLTNTMVGAGYVGGFATQSDSNVVYAGNFLAWSTNNGLNWNTFGTQGSQYGDTDISEEYFFVCDGGGNLLRKNFGSANWQYSSQGKKLGRVTGFKNTIFAVGADSIYLSNDTGNSWRGIKAPLTDITDIEFTGSYLYLGTESNGLWRWKFEDILTTGLRETNETETLLLYPNPASNEIEISGLPRESTIQIFSSSGQLVSEQSLNAINTRVDLRMFVSGIYYLRYWSDGSSGARKFIVER